MIGVVNYLDILHHLVSLYPDRLFNYNYSIRELGIGSYAAVWKVSEDTPLHEGRFIAVCSPSAPADGDAVHRLRPRHRCRRWLSSLSHFRQLAGRVPAHRPCLLYTSDAADEL